MNVIAKALSPELMDDFFHFFDHVAFSDNPDWASCYCYYFHVAGDLEQWGRRKKEENRTAAEQFITTGKMNGYLAYFDGSPVGWCNANSKAGYARVAADKDLADGGDENVGSVVCFVIAPGFRKQGIARQLLAEACSGFKDKRIRLRRRLSPERQFNRRPALPWPAFDVSKSRIHDL